MKTSGNKAILVFLSLFITAVFVLPFISSCGKAGIVNGASSNTQLAVFNLSPNIGPIDLYAVTNVVIKQNTSSFIYTVPGSYFYVSPSDTLLQVRTTQDPTKTILSVDTTNKVLNLMPHHKYSLYITGLASGLTSIFTVDDVVDTPKAGYGAMRFINASLQQQNVGLDVTANGTQAFSAIKYKQISPYIFLPAGNYNFQINQTGTSTVFATPAVQSVTIKDGGLYTMYSYGVVGATDTSAFNASVFTNR